MKGKPITIWANEREEKLLRDMANKEDRSVSNFVKHKCNILKEKNK